MPRGSPLAPFEEEDAGVVVLDGGLATELQDRGHDLDHPLWSARLLRSRPEAILDVHRAYLAAGADCLISASYQASVPGLVAAGASEKEAQRVLGLSVEIARQACEEHRASRTGARSRRPPPLVAASIGPYGAYLANGAEYRGNYGISRDELRAFHRSRWETLSGSGPDLIACETIPSVLEAEILRELLDETTGCPAWISFSCRDATRIRDGTPLTACAALFEDCDRVLAVGVNCTAPRHVRGLIERARAGAPGKRVVVYPNSGQTYDARRRTWVGDSDPAGFGALAREWRAGGATLIGGCCRTGPRHIREIRAAFGL